MSAAMITCLSHSPIIPLCKKPPPEEAAIAAGLARCRGAIARFDPEVIILFGSDHFAGFHLDLVPAFCIGLEAAAYDDVGGTPGPLDVPKDQALALVEHLRDEGFDPAVSHRMKVDHGFSQPLGRLFGRNDRYPIIPVFVNALSPPLARFSRSRALGAAAGRYAARSGKRTLFLASQASSTAFVCPSGKPSARVQCSRPSQALVRRNNEANFRPPSGAWHWRK